MMKLLFILFFIIMYSLYKNNFWMVQIYLIFYFFFYQLKYNVYIYMSNISYFCGVDSISYFFIMLSMWIMFLMLLASKLIYKNKLNIIMFNFNLLLLLFILIISFISMSLMIFYLFFESSLIPTLFLILGWGYQPERIQASLYLLFYMLMVSLPMMMGIFYLYYKMYSMNFYILSNFMFYNELLYLSMILAFLVKMPMFLVHLWLPKAHVEAPISGSMILAGVLLKLGGYGLIRIMPIFMNINMKYNYIWISISVLGMILISLNCIRQVDLKLLIAYSSVSHMSMILCGLMTMNYYGMIGSINLMIAHGLCSSGLFCLANISYERLSSRSLFINKGLLNLMPSMSLWWFMLCSMNMAIPPSLNLLSEILLMNSLIMWSWLMLLYIFIMSFFSGLYSLYLYSYSQHGQLYNGLFSFNSGELREFLLMFLHWFPLNVLMFKMMLLN
nr:NADH dehydrogenase subunit 4 [Dipseliopoda setosa]